MNTNRHRLIGLAAVGSLLAALGVASTWAAAAASAQPAHAARCGNGALAVTRSFVDGAAGHSYMLLIYRNKTTHTCTVRGFPGLDAVNRRGHVLAHAARSGSGKHLDTVRVGPGKYASAEVEWLNFNGKTGGSCRFSTAVNTIVANTTRVHRLVVSVSACQLQVGPTGAGTAPYPHFGPAQHDWIQGSKVDAAGTNRYLAKAENQLKKSHSFPYQVKELDQLRKLPDTGLTPKQRKQARRDVRDLDTLFGTPGLYF